MVQMLLECKVSKFNIAASCTLTVMAMSITNNSKEHRFQFRINGKTLSKSNLAQFSRWNPFRIYEILVVVFTKWLQSFYCMFSRFCILSNNTWRSACFILTGYHTIFTVDFSLDYKAAILSRRKPINKHVCCECKSGGAIVLWMLSPGTTEYVNTVFYHICEVVTSIGCAY